MDWVVQKAVELGVARIQPIMTKRSVMRLSGERAARRVMHWRNIAIAACEQSGRNRVPEVAPIVELPGYLGQAVKNAAECRFICAPGANRIASPAGGSCFCQRNRLLCWLARKAALMRVNYQPPPPLVFSPFGWGRACCALKRQALLR
jgi:hypothetical protein